MRLLIFLVFFSVTLVSGIFAGVHKYTYRVTSAGKTNSSVVSVEETPEGYNLLSENQDGNNIYSSVLDKELSTVQTHSVDIREKTDIKLEKKNGRIYVEGTLAGKPLKKDIDAKKADFRHYFSFQLQSFAVSAKKLTSFVSLKPDTMEPYEFEAKKEGTTNLTIGGQAVEAVKIKVNLSGALAMFWTGYLYYRTSDGLYVREEEKDPKGNPVIIELKQEE